MTAYRFVTLTCDHCGEVWDEADTNSITEARRMAFSRGWTIGRADRRWWDLCPKCAAKGYGKGRSGAARALGLPARA